MFFLTTKDVRNTLVAINVQQITTFHATARNTTRVYSSDGSFVEIEDDFATFNSAISNLITLMNSGYRQ